LTFLCSDGSSDGSNAETRYRVSDDAASAAIRQAARWTDSHRVSVIVVLIDQGRPILVLRFDRLLRVAHPRRVYAHLQARHSLKRSKCSTRKRGYRTSSTTSDTRMIRKFERERERSRRISSAGIDRSPTDVHRFTGSETFDARFS